jgi:hypothetical protein
MEKDFKPIKSVYNTNDEVIKSIMDLYEIEQFDLDCTYSTGNFWKNLPAPKLKSDLFPKNDTIIKASSENLPFDDNSMKSVMYDPPFVIAGKTYRDNAEGSSIIAKRYEGYESYGHLMRNYYNTLKELYRITEKDGLVVFKCQDTVSGGRNHFTHSMVMNMAMELGFYPKDLFVLVANLRINSFGTKWTRQQHARKYHSYFWVFQKTKPKVKYDFSNIEPYSEEVIIEQDSEESPNT